MSRKKKKEEEKKMPFIVATYVYASSQGQQTHSARTNSFCYCWAWWLVLHDRADPTEAEYLGTGEHAVSAAVEDVEGWRKTSALEEQIHLPPLPDKDC